MKDENLAAQVAKLMAKHARRPRLINIAEGSGKDIIPLGRAMLLIGRTDDADVNLADNEISRNHASIVKLGDHYCLRDNGSMNGSYVDGERVKFKQLEHHDVIRFGPYTFLVDLGDEAEENLRPQAASKQEPQVEIPGSHKDENFKMVYNLNVKAPSTGGGSPSPDSSLTIVTKGGSGRKMDGPGKTKKIPSVCPFCKMEIVEPSYGVCAACGETLPE